MARNRCLVLLGYEDDPISEKQQKMVDYTTNKVGGKANWPSSEVIVPACPLCGTARRLVLQIYAPLEGSAFHRTLYIFGCINSPCSSLSASWTCVRVQMLEKSYEKETKTRRVEKIEWCTGADEWDDVQEENSNEENGNVIPKCDNSRMSDEEDESNSLGSDPIPNFNSLGLADDKNANASGACAVEVPSNRPSAEIEGGEAEVIMLDSPPIPQKDIYLLLNPHKPSDVAPDVALQSFFIAVDEEKVSNDAVSDHIRDLIMDYESRDELATKRNCSPDESSGAAGGYEEGETYERGVPLHGDLMFHHFVQKIQENPGQIIRYSREATPLLMAPLREPLQKCQNCGCDAICEVQILSTIIPKLRLESGEAAAFDFGSVLVYTCVKSCWDTPDKMRLEAVVVQQEELPPSKN